MAGVYVHIPFCKSRCKYCDFFSTTLLERREDYVQAVLRELEERKDYLGTERVGTVYFGGGTPSMLSPEQIGTVLEGIRKRFVLESDAEVTLEANPQDVDAAKLEAWKQVGVNRLSMGVQTFGDAKLCAIGRRHNAEQAFAAVRAAKEAGFGNISIDLIYGLPGETMDEWKRDVSQAIGLEIQHVSAYCLSYENGTELTKMLERGEIEEVDEEVENAMYDYLVEALAAAGLERYEVSNFAKPGFESRHNSSYWKGIKYLGVGAGAHSYDGESRQWNVSDLEAYLRGLLPLRKSSENIPQNPRYARPPAPFHGRHGSEEYLQSNRIACGDRGSKELEGEEARGRMDFEKGERRYWECEVLSEEDRYNEMVMLGLRTREGVKLEDVPERFRGHCEEKALPYLEKQWLKQVGGRLVATNEGIHVLNRVIEDLMV